MKKATYRSAWKHRGRSIGYCVGGVYYIARTMGGRRVRISTGCVTEEAALAEYRKFEVAPAAYVSPNGRRAFSARAARGSPLPPAESAWRRERRFALRYKITPEQYDALMEVQAGRCAICGTRAEDTERKALEVDHCHTTGAIRGLLCGHCNRGIGQLRDSPDLLRDAADYLEASRADRGPDVAPRPIPERERAIPVAQNRP